MQAALQDLRNEFTVDAEQVALFEKSFTSSLTADSTFLPSSLDVFPNGAEQGQYLAIDLGGSNLRCAVVTLKGTGAPNIDCHQAWTIPSPYKVGSASALFFWIASCIAQVTCHYDSVKSWKLGVTFSFPVQETSISSGLIMDMGKTYDLTFSEPAGRCIKALLSAALSEAKVLAEIVICVNDSSATLLSQAYMDESARMSLILGTGCNAAMYMPSSLLESSGTPRIDTEGSGKHVFVNCELSLLGKDVLPCNKYDHIINGYDINRGFQPMEYATTGPWLGELVRLIVLEFIQTYKFVSGKVPESLLAMFSLQTDTLWRIEAAASLEEVQRILDESHPQGEKSWTLNEAQQLKEISIIVTNRSACLVATSLCALRSLLGTGADNGTLLVAYCGSIIEGFPKYCARVQSCLESLQAGISLVKNRNSGILGAAIGAACIADHT